MILIMSMAWMVLLDWLVEVFQLLRLRPFQTTFISALSSFHNFDVDDLDHVLGLDGVLLGLDVKYFWGVTPDIIPDNFY